MVATVEIDSTSGAVRRKTYQNLLSFLLLQALPVFSMIKREKLLIEAPAGTGVRERFLIETPTPAGLLTDGKENGETKREARALIVDKKDESEKQ